MKLFRPLALLFALASLGAPVLRAQWKTETYVLKAGWSGIYLHGDASYTTPSELFKNYPAVDQVWRWNPNPDQIQFSTSPAVPDATSSEWTIWNRNDPAEQMLTAMIGQSSYLIHCTGAVGTTTTVLITQKPRPPAATWLITGANFMGFPADSASSTPTFTNYFASFPIATTFPSKIYKYVGGELGPANPIEVTAPGTEKIDRKTAYWFQAATVGSFTGLVAYELPTNDGLAFGRTIDTITVGVSNLSTSAVTLTLSTQVSDSEFASGGLTGVAGSVPLTYRVYNSTTNSYTSTPIVGSFTVSVPANGRLDLQFGIDRTQLTGSPASLYASLLNIKDSAHQTDVFLPVSAQSATPSGLWIGEIKVSSVVSTVAGSPGATTARYFPLRAIIHVDDAGVARLLSQAFVGALDVSGHPLGICTKEVGLSSDSKSTALRLVSSQMPLDRVITGTGAFAVGQTLTYTITLPFDDATNPFVHEYHPDHDNRDARFNRYTTPGAESYTITRTCTLTFTAAPPDGSTVTGWGTTVYGGTYTETITGLNKQPLTTRGGFGLRRVSEIATITLN